MFSFDKPREYHDELRSNVDELLVAETIAEAGSPSWVANNVTNQKTHSEESPLFTHHLLAASRVRDRHINYNFGEKNNKYLVFNTTETSHLNLRANTRNRRRAALAAALRAAAILCGESIAFLRMHLRTCA